MRSAPRRARWVGYVALWLATAVLASAVRSAIPLAYQELATVVAVIVLACFMVAILIPQAKPIARTLRDWRSQL
jgi:uncharacterized membrane protein YhaH (DUF805 family)